MLPKVEIHNRAIQSRKESLSSWRIPVVERKALARFLEELGLGKVNRGRRITESRQSKYLDVLRAPLETFGKPLQRLTIKDVEQFEEALASGILQSNRGQPYAHATKVDMRRALKVYLRWRLGPDRASKLAGWLDTRDARKTPDFVRHTEIEALYKACKCAEERFLVAVLFDTGARPGEFCNLRCEDIELPRDKESYVRLTLREEYSKTKGRTISLYWKHSQEAVADYLAERQRQGVKSDEPVFANTYLAARLFLFRLGRKVLKRRVTFTLMRHSSATYYADKMNRQQLCVRYGWAFSSRMPDTYIARAGVEMKELDARFAASELGTLKETVERLQRDANIKDERLKQLEAHLHALNKHFPIVADLMAHNPSPVEVESAIRVKRARITE